MDDERTDLADVPALIARLRRERDEARERLFDNGHNHDATSCSLGSLCPWCAVCHAERERDEARKMCEIEYPGEIPENLHLADVIEKYVARRLREERDEAREDVRRADKSWREWAENRIGADRAERDALAARVAALEVCLRRSDAMIDAAVHEVIGDDDAARKFRHDLRQTRAENHRAISPAPAEQEQP